MWFHIKCSQGFVPSSTAVDAVAVSLYMPFFLFLLAFAIAVPVYGQLLPDALTTAKELHGKGMFAEAYAEYHRALAMGDSSTALRFYLAQMCMTTDRPAEAIEHITFVLDREKRNASSWVIRGEARRQTGDSTGACDDFVQAELRGNQAAGRLLEQYCGRRSTKAPRIAFDLPEEQQWYAADVRNSGRAEVTTWLPKHDTSQAVDESFTITIVDEVNAPGPPDSMMMGMVAEALRRAPGLTHERLSLDTLAGFECILFRMTTKAIDARPPTEQLWLLLHATNALYIVHYDTTVPPTATHRARWLAVLRTLRFASAY